MHPERSRGAKTAEIALELGTLAMQFASIDRIPRYEHGERENDAEHGYMLALVAPEISEALELNLNTSLITQYALVHDLVELRTGDVATFLFDKHAEQQKEIDETSALHELALSLPPHTRSLLLRYESQQDPEARFTRYIDKLLPLVIDVIGQGARVMEDDYEVRGEDALRKCHQALHDQLVYKFNEEFPEIDLAHRILCELFQTVYHEKNTTQENLGQEPSSTS